MVAPNDMVVADIKVGENFKGTTLSYLPAQSARLGYVSAGIVTDFTPRLGDKPAVSLPAPAQGLLTLVYETKANTLTYREWQKFLNFTSHKAFPQAVEAHTARGLPQTGFKERYYRHVKSLIAVGQGAGADQALGLRLELVALDNPYTTTKGVIAVQLLDNGAPRPMTQIEIFEMAPDDTVTVSTTTTDERGHARVPLRAGHRYLVDAVIMLDTGNDDVEDAPVWESRWAGLTFAVPLE